jgi:hypothetical protein
MKLLRCSETISQSVGDELLLLERQAGRLHHLNSTAAWIYQRCDGRTSEEIAIELSQNYGIDPYVAERDFRAVATQLAQLGLIQFAEMPSASLPNPRQ